MTERDHAACEYPELLARHYDHDYAALGQTQDIAFYLELAREARGAVLEVGCGTGRVVLPIARSGRDVTGVDPSPAMRARLEAKLAAEPDDVAGRVSLDEGHFEDIPADGPYALVFSAFRAFMHLHTREQHVAGLKEMARVLAPNGLLAFDVFDFNPRIAEKFAGEHNDATYVMDGETVRRYCSSRFDDATRLLHVDLSWRRGEEGVGPSSGCTLRVFRPDELRTLLAEAGLRAHAMWADFDGEPVNPDEPGNLVVLAKHG